MDALDIIGQIPKGTECIWLRDEGHIRTNRFDELLMDVCYKIINFSATNTHSDIQCNFTQTMMLRTVNQKNGTPEDAVTKLLEVKKKHKKISNYNPCAIFRCVGENTELYNNIVQLCKKYNLKYINITEDPYIMSELCEDDNDYDVIINKFKLVEGIDIRRAHVLYMDNQPSNNITTIQAIGRCRRNALLYRDDIDIFAPENNSLLENTRECYVYYNVKQMKIATDSDRELQYAFCDHISCEALKTGIPVDVVNGQLSNGLYVIELARKTGKFNINTDPVTGFNIIEPITDFYEKCVKHFDNSYVYTGSINVGYKKVHIDCVKSLPIFNTKTNFDIETNEYKTIKVEPYYIIKSRHIEENVKYNISWDLLDLYEKLSRKYTHDYIYSKIKDYCIDTILKNKLVCSSNEIKTFVEKYILDNKDTKGCKKLCKFLLEVDRYSVTINGSECKLKELCSIEELYLLKYACIKKKQEGFTNTDVEIFVNDFIDLKNKIYTFKLEVMYPKSLNVEKSDIIAYFKRFDEIFEYLIKGHKVTFINSIDVIKFITNSIQRTYQDLKNNVIRAVLYISDNIFEKVTGEEKFLLDNGYIKRWYTIPVEIVNRLELGMHKPYDKIVNDMETAIIGVDLMRQIRTDDSHIVWTETKSVSSKIGNYNKFNLYITKKYSNELNQAKTQYISGKNKFYLDKKCNSMLGYCVEYYSKYLLYGKHYLGEFIGKAQKEAKTTSLNDCIIIRGCMLKYKELMVKCFGLGVSKIITGISADKLVQSQYTYFVDLVVELGRRTAEYVRSTLYPGIDPKNDIDANLSVRHIAGLADYITADTILDVKVRNNIDEKCVRQVLAYHYLSTKRSDLDINRVIVYDAVSDKAVTINISDYNRGINSCKWTL